MKITYDEVEKIILDTEPAELSDHGDKIWTRRMAVALADRFNAAALAVQTQQGVEGLGWHKPDQRNSLSRAENNLGVYRVWTYFEANGRWFWSLDGYEKVSGECASEDEAKAAAQSDYETRIRSALVDVPAVESEPVANDDALLKAALAVEQWWFERGKFRFDGAPSAILALRVALSTRKGSAGDGAATGTNGGDHG